MAHTPNPIESRLHNEGRIQLKVKEIKEAIHLLKDHGYTIIDLEGNFIKKHSEIDVEE
tara:strand:+ start:1661 stop:1834 length:174 start_codon:yes stop_codon:yes gene_type:complete